MSNFFVDTSALAKRYLLESGSAWVTNWIEPSAGNVIIIADTTTIAMFSLRTLDAIQLASAIYALGVLQEPITFVSADQNLLTYAQAEGFVTENPNHYP